MSTTTPTKEVTAMQELILQIDELIKNSAIPEQPILTEKIQGPYKQARKIAQSLLPKEREQIVEAWQDGYYANCENEENNATDYFNSKYKQ